jgi:hypothetical protein
MKVYVVVDKKRRVTSGIKADALVKDVLLAKSVYRGEGEKILLNGVEVKDTAPLKAGDVVTYTSAKHVSK